jgi:hypothetical protein
VAWMEVNAYGGPKRTVAIPASAGWTKVILRDISVTAGEARIGFYSMADAGQWLHFDEVHFTRQSVEPPPPPPPPPDPEPPNLIVNPSFEEDAAETQTPYGWLTWSGGGYDYADRTETSGSVYSGTYYGTHFAPWPYDVFTYQIVRGLASDMYQLSGWVKSSGGQSVVWMEVNAYGGPKRTVAIPASAGWTKVILSDIAVTAGEARIGFYSIADTGQWLYFDEVQFTRQSVTRAQPP